MNREKAIDLLDNLIGMVEDNQESDYDTALKMGIQALSQEPCDVSVSEKEPNEITEEVTLRFFKNTLKVRWHDFVIYNVEWLKKNWQMEMDIVCGVKPCDDAISREAVQIAMALDNISDIAKEIKSKLPSVQPKPTECEDAVSREFVELVVEYPPADLCAYSEYKGKPYYSIKYYENGEEFIGYGTYKPEVLSRYLKEYFISSVTHKSGKWIEDAKTYYEELNKRGLGVDEYIPYFTDDIACSECLAKYNTIDNETEFFKYCPNCGAKMESEGAE